MNSVVLHIGTTETDTSSLQHFSDDERVHLVEAGARSPSAGRSKGGRRAQQNLCYVISAEQSGSARHDRSRRGGSDALGEIDKLGAAIGLISSEAFLCCTTDAVRREPARFGRVGLSSRESVAEDGRSPGDCARTLLPWIDHFCDQSIDVRIPDSVNRDSGVVSDFVNSYFSTLGGSVTLGDRPSVNRKAGLKQLLAAATVVRNCQSELGDQSSLVSHSPMRISLFFRDRDSFDYPACSLNDALEIDQHFAASNEELALASTNFRSTGPFDTSVPDEFRHPVDLTRLDDGLFDLEERRFVERLTEQVIHHVEETTP